MNKYQTLFEACKSLVLFVIYVIHLVASWFLPLVCSDMSIPQYHTLRHAFRYTISPCLRGMQRRHAQVHDARFLVTHGHPDKIIEDKYREKLHRKAKE